MSARAPRHPLAWIPYALIGSRVALGPVLLALAATRHFGAPFFVLLIAAVVSDILDGMIARRLGSSTPRLRQLDGIADLLLYLQLAAAVWLVDRDTVVSLAIPVAILFVGQIALYAFAIARYRKGPSYHGVTAKAWGLGLTVAFIVIFGAQRPEVGLWIALVLGYINTLDELAMTAILREWHTDVLTIRHALSLRKSVIGKG